MKKMRLLYAMIGVALLTGTAACTSGGTKDTGQPAASEKPSAKPADDKNKKYTITALDFAGAENPVKDAPAHKMINEKFNIDYDFTFVPSNAYEEKLSAVFASGQIPDMVGLQGGDHKGRYNQFSKQGAFLALDEYIDKYPTLKAVPPQIWDSLRVSGKIYAIPQYFPPFNATPVIRKDWLDNLGLKVPTNYEELRQVAIAFTKGDPDKNGKNGDTYGINMGLGISPNYNMGAYWDPTAWYHKDQAGNLIPGLISPARKEMIQLFADLHKEKALTADYATMNANDMNKEFYSGKAGIYVGSPRGMSQVLWEGLLKLQPNAKVVALEPFKAPDGSEGFAAGKGFAGMTVLSSKLAGDPGKVTRILEMINFGRQFYPVDDRKPTNKDFDWWWGKEGQGYTMENGVATIKKEFPTNGLTPSVYFVDTVNWVPKDATNVYKVQYSVPQLVDLVVQLENMHAAKKMYADPYNTVLSPADMEKSAALNKFLTDEQVKMINGSKPISDWDKMVKEYMDKGGTQIIKEVNDGIKNKDTKSRFQ